MLDELPVRFRFPQGGDPLSIVRNSDGKPLYYQGQFPESSEESKLLTLADLDAETLDCGDYWITRGSTALFFSGKYSGDVLRKQYLPLLDELFAGLFPDEMDFVSSELDYDGSAEEFIISTKFEFRFEERSGAAEAAQKLEQVVFAYETLASKALADRELFGKAELEFSDASGRITITPEFFGGEMPSPDPEEDSVIGSITPTGSRERTGSRLRIGPEFPHQTFETIFLRGVPERIGEAVPGPVIFYQGPLLKAEYSVRNGWLEIDSTSEAWAAPVTDLLISGTHRGNYYVLEAEFTLEPQAPGDVEKLKDAFFDYDVQYLQRERRFKLANYFVELPEAGIDGEPLASKVHSKLIELSEGLSNVLSRLFPMQDRSFYFAPIGVPLDNGTLAEDIGKSLRWRREVDYHFAREQKNDPQNSGEKPGIVSAAERYLAEQFPGRFGGS